MEVLDKNSQIQAAQKIREIWEEKKRRRGIRKSKKKGKIYSRVQAAQKIQETGEKKKSRGVRQPRKKGDIHSISK